MALSFHPTTAPVFGHGLPAPDAADVTSFLHDVHPEVSDALLGFVYDPLDAASTDAVLEDLLSIPNDADAFTTGPVVDDCDVSGFLGPIEDQFLTEVIEVEQHCDKKLRTACNCNQQAPAALPEFLTEFDLPPPPLKQPPTPLTFVHGADDAKKPGGNGGQSVQSTAARERRRRISQKTAELSRLIPGGHRLSTAEMLHEAAHHVKLLQAQVGMLALMRSVGSSENEKLPIAAVQEQMHALLVSGSVQERLTAERKCLVPRKLVDAMARDKAVKSNPLVNRDLTRFLASLEQQ